MKLFTKRIVINTLCLSTALVVLLAITAVAAEKLTVDKCVDLALKSSQGIKIAEQKMLSSKYAVDEASARNFPDFTFMAMYVKMSPMPETKTSFQMPVGVNPLTGSIIYAPVSFNIKTGYDYLYDFKLSVSQPLYTFGKIGLGVKQSKIGYKAAEEELRRAKNELVFNTKRAYYGLMLTQKMVAIAEEAVKVTDEHYKTMQLMYEDGKISKYDLSRIKVQLTNAQVGLIRAKNGGRMAKEAVEVMLKTSLDNYELETEFEYNPNAAVIEDVFAEALKTRPELKQLGFQEDIMNLLVKLTNASGLPNLALSASADYKMPYYTEEKWDSAWNASLVFNWPLNFYTGAKVKQMKTNVETMKLTRSQVEDGIRLETKKAVIDLNEAKERIDVQKENVELAKENLRIADQRYKEGYMSYVDVRDVQLALTQSEVNYYQALFDYNIAQASLVKAVGK
ncbi:MAG: TolC family protein [Elusimicrobiota bacterium]